MGGVHRGIKKSLSFSAAILKSKAQGFLPLVADIKPISPRDGDLVKRRNPAELARILYQAGVCALSVVTEPEHFGGSIQLLQEVTRAVPLPVLRKDFITSRKQIEESRDAGAAAVLLILAMIPKEGLAELYQYAISLGMEAVIEIHTREELEYALILSPAIIGINNRDILKLEKDAGDVRITEKLAPLVPEGVLTISESSLRTPEEIRRAFKAGSDAVLVGTAILESDDPVSRLKELTLLVE